MITIYLIIGNTLHSSYNNVIYVQIVIFEIKIFVFFLY